MFNLSKPLYKSDLLLGNIKTLIRKAKEANAPVIYIRHCGSKNSHFMKGSSGWNIHPLIIPGVNDYVFEKNHSDLFQDTRLKDILKKIGVEQLVICGLVTEGYVDTTTRRAYSLGY